MSEELLEREGSLGLLGYPELKVFQEPQDQTDLRAVPDLQVLWVIWVLQVFKECQERGASLDPRVLKENGEL